MRRRPPPANGARVRSGSATEAVARMSSSQLARIARSLTAPASGLFCGKYVPTAGCRSRADEHSVANVAPPRPLFRDVRRLPELEAFAREIGLATSWQR